MYYFIECMQNGFSHWNEWARSNEEGHAIRTAQQIAASQGPNYRWRVRDSNGSVRFIL